MLTLNFVLLQLCMQAGILVAINPQQRQVQFPHMNAKLLNANYRLFTLLVTQSLRHVRPCLTW